MTPLVYTNSLWFQNKKLNIFGTDHKIDFVEKLGYIRLQPHPQTLISFQISAQMIFIKQFKLVGRGLRLSTVCFLVYELTLYEISCGFQGVDKLINKARFPSSTLYEKEKLQLLKHSLSNDSPFVEREKT